jgi:uncharacterized tellurite resistance protein B-like protein
MLESLKHFLTEFSGGRKKPDQFDESDYRLGAAALLIHAVTVEGDMSPQARDRLHEILKNRFGLDDRDTARLIEAATAADREAVDLYHFTRLLNRSLDEDGRRRIVEMMWEIIYTDGRVTELEDNVVWRASDLLGVSSRDRIELRHAVAARLGKPVSRK